MLFYSVCYITQTNTLCKRISEQNHLILLTQTTVDKLPATLFNRKTHTHTTHAHTYTHTHTHHTHAHTHTHHTHAHTHTHHTHTTHTHTHTHTAGTYYVAVRGYDANETGAYTLQTGFTTARPASDDHGDTSGRATRVGLNSTTAGSIEHADDTDYFRITVTQAGTLTVETTGTTDTYGYLQNAAGTTLAENDDGGGGRNFQIVEAVTTGTYYVEVEGFDENDIGPYALRVRFTAAPSGGSGLSSLLGTWQFTFRIAVTFTDTYRLSRVDSSTGIPLIWGANEYGNPVTAGRIRDLVPSSPLPYEFALLDPGISICNFYLFNKTGSNSVSGVYYLIRDGDCDVSVGLSNPYSMTGTRISLATQADRTARQSQAARTGQRRSELQRAEEARTMEGKSTSRTARSARRNDHLLPDIVKALSRQLADSP